MISVDDNGIIVEVGTKQGENEEENAEIENQNKPMKDQIDEASKETDYAATSPKKVVKTKSEMEEHFFSHVQGIEARLSAIEKTNETLKAENIQLSNENEELKKQLAESPAAHSKFNPEEEAPRSIQFKIGAKREENITDRIYNALF